MTSGSRPVRCALRAGRAERAVAAHGLGRAAEARRGQRVGGVGRPRREQEPPSDVRAAAADGQGRQRGRLRPKRGRQGRRAHRGGRRANREELHLARGVLRGLPGGQLSGILGLGGLLQVLWCSKRV